MEKPALLSIRKIHESIVDAVTRVKALPPSLREDLVDRSEKVVRERYDWNSVSRDVERLFNAITQ
jgi:glycosyltransferase involved in cell wall biosynthesis